MSEGTTCLVFDPATGQVTGRIGLPDGLESPWANLRVDGDYLVGSSGPHVLCMDRRTGDLRWRFQASRSSLSLAVGDGRVFCAEVADQRRGENEARDGSLMAWTSPLANDSGNGPAAPDCGTARGPGCGDHPRRLLSRQRWYARVASRRSCPAQLVVQAGGCPRRSARMGRRQPAADRHRTTADRLRPPVGTSRLANRSSGSAAAVPTRGPAPIWSRRVTAAIRPGSICTVARSPRSSACGRAAA
jgi:hypothetical protein